MLTGNVKARFEYWFITEYEGRGIEEIGGNPRLKDYMDDNFYDNSLCEQWGVFQEFADSEGYYMGVNRDIDEDGVDLGYFYLLHLPQKYHAWEYVLNTTFESRTEAMTKAIEMLDKKMNNPDFPF